MTTSSLSQECRCWLNVQLEKMPNTTTPTSEALAGIFRGKKNFEDPHSGSLMLHSVHGIKEDGWQHIAQKTPLVASARTTKAK